MIIMMIIFINHKLKIQKCAVHVTSYLMALSSNIDHWALSLWLVLIITLQQQLI